MKIDAVGVTSTNLKKTTGFYTLLGFDFPDFAEDEVHLEPITAPGSARLMIDTKELAEEILGEPPQPGNHSSFAIQFDNPEGVDSAAARVQAGGFRVVKEPWDAFWGQRYAVVEDPDGYKVDLYAALRPSP